ncbi:sigma factor-like helix-turn-helix DNA-binding protein [Pseudomonas sp. NPDC089569]|uniref:sigma factor-like helix-turn-helix DNA-binding protein n=1 Tax=Pseudomonas sp. NPDC089569 TaxID=3390722 RepID=UPI003D06C00D
MNNAVLKTEVVSSAAAKTTAVGFRLPATMPSLPQLSDPKGLLTAEQEQDLGFGIIMGQLDLLRALAVDTEIVLLMLDEIWAAMGDKDAVSKAVTLIFTDGVWVRVDEIDNKDFAALTRKKLNAIQTLVAELNTYSKDGMDGTLFAAVVREELRQKLSEIVPYDYILNRAADQFRAKCKSLNLLCKDLVEYIAAEVRIPRKKVEGIVSGNWTSPKLISSLLQSGGYELKFYPPVEMRRLRTGIIDRQNKIMESASTGQAPAAELLASWSAFGRFDRQIKACVELFVKANFRLVERMVYQYKFSDLEVVRSAANMGLVRAIYRFAPDKGFKFSTIAVSWIQQSILRDLNQQEMIRLPEGTYEVLSKLKAALGENPNASLESLIEITGLKEDDVRNLMFHVGIGKPISLDSTFQEGGSAESDGMHEMLADTNNCFVEEVLEENASNYITGVLAGVLGERELFVVVNRFGIGDVEAKTLEEMSVIMTLSKERVRQIQCQALAKLRDSEFGEDLFELWEE